MKYIELTVTTTSSGEELISDIMWEYTSYGVSISSAQDVLDLINKRRSTFDYIDDELLSTTTDVYVKAYFDVGVADKIIAEIEKRLIDLSKTASEFLPLGSLETVKREIDGDDWIEVWRKHYRPIDLGKIIVCPEWIDCKAKDGQQIVKIDSNLAFGTGEHETTSMCIEMLSEIVKSGDTVIDVGTGSGILGISAIKLGAKKSYMTDIDETAVKVATHNAKLNGVDDKCVVCLNDLLKGKDVKGDIVVANITADVLIILAKTINENVKDGGTIIMSGILLSKAEEVISCYKGLGYELIKRQDKGEWTAIRLIRK